MSGARVGGVGGRSAAAIEFRHVTKRFEPREQRAVAPAAVNDLSLSVPAGEICVLVGPSGCGKTTSLKMVNRLVEPTSGQVLLDGQDVAHVHAVALRRGIGYVIQQTGLFPHQTVADNVATVPRLLRWPRDRIARRVDELLALVGFDPAQMGGRYPAQLSGGERQRVGVARALAAEPPVLLMDEPFGAVDPIVRSRLQDEFLRIQRQLGTTVLFVTHDIDEAIKVGDRVAVLMEGGRLAQYSPPAELLARPASEYVAQFVGADRALKRLALMTVGQLELAPAVGGRNDGPRYTLETSVRDALATLLSAPDETGVVVNAQDVPIGVITLESVVKALRADSLAQTTQAANERESAIVASEANNVSGS
jgi:osmoprotectant transport system ATP-binding protein